MTRDHLQNPSLAERNRHTSCFCSSVCEEPLLLFVLHVPTCLLAGSPSPPRTAWLRAGFPHEIRWGQRCNGYSQDPAFHWHFSHTNPSIWSQFTIFQHVYTYTYIYINHTSYSRYQYIYMYIYTMFVDIDIKYSMAFFPLKLNDLDDFELSSP